MALSRAFQLVAVAIIAVVVVLAPATAKTIRVGGDEAGGWQDGFDYQTWANSVEFNEDDILEFVYTAGEHNVMQMYNNYDMKNCQVEAAVETWESGSDQITLQDGSYFFICGIDNHCSKGTMKFFISVNPMI